jgi:hypothetical protein
MATILMTPDSAGKCGKQGGAGSPCTDGCDGNYCSCDPAADYNITVYDPNYQPTQSEIDKMNSECKARDTYSYLRPWSGPYYKEMDPLLDGNPVSSFECDTKWEFVNGAWKGSKSACFQCMTPPPY